VKGLATTLTEKLRTGRYDGDSPDVLVIDDDEDVRWALLELVQILGFVAVGACNGAQGLKLACDRRPRVILLDLRMPVMDGYQFLQRRQADPALAQIPVVVITAEAAVDPIVPEVQQLLRKPIGEEELRAALEALPLAPRAAAVS